MRKHFLILMLMALLPLAGWAEGEPTAKTNLVYNQSAQALINAGTGATYYYAAVAEGAEAPAASVYTNEIPEKKEGSWDVYYIQSADAPTNVTGAQHITVTIAPIDLSTAGYAITLSANSVYNGSVQTPTITLTKSGTPATLTAEEFSVSWNGELKNAGEYTVTVSGDDVHTKNAPASLTKKWTINKAQLTLTAATPVPSSVEFGTAHPVWTADMTGFVNDAEKAQLFNAANVTFTVKKNGETDARTEDVLEAGTYTITPAYASIGSNYKLDAAHTITTNFTVLPKALTGLTVTGLNSQVYNGNVQKPANVVVKDADGNTAAAQYTVKYFATEARTGSEATVKNATTYYVLIESKAGENYSFTIADKTYTITQAPLLVYPAGEKIYDGYVGGDQNGTAGNEVDATFDYQGLRDATAPTITVTDKKAYTVVNAKKDAGKYVMTVEASNFSVAGNNYVIKPQNGTFEIKQLETLKVTATDVPDLAYGSAENFTATLTDGTYVAADATAIKDAIKVTKSETANEDGEWTLTPGFKTEDEIDADESYYASIDEAVDAITTMSAEEKAAEKASRKAARKAAAKAILVNYLLKDENITEGTLTYANAVLSIALKQSEFTLTKVYDGQPISIAAPTSEDQLIILGKQNESDDIDLSGLTLTVTPSDANGDATLKNVGTYQVTLSGAAAEHYTIDYIPSQFKITARPLKVKLFDQTFVTGTVPSINPNAFQITNNDEENEGLADGDKAEEIFKVAFTDAITVNATTGKIETAANETPVANAITIVTAGATSKWANYNFGTEGAYITKGKALILPNTTATVVLDDTKDLTTVLTADVNNAVVTFNARALNAEKWNVLVLPFDIAVKDLSDAFDYAVIDVLDEANSNGNMSFKLKVSGKIDANTPFMIYPSGVKNNLNQVTFTGVNVKKQTKATVEVKDAKNNKFVGTYKTTGIYGEKFYYMKAGEWKRAGLFTETEPAPVKPLRAYIDLSESTAAAPIITIEEPDGNTTAIKVLDVDTMETYSVDGWYTLNGVKLQGVPTQKGIYINNGKKVVVK